MKRSTASVTLSSKRPPQSLASLGLGSADWAWAAQRTSSLDMAILGAGNDVVGEGRGCFGMKWSSEGEQSESEELKTAKDSIVGRLTHSHTRRESFGRN